MEKKSKAHLTNEKISGKFKSIFELVNYAIKLAENMIKTGRDTRVKSDVQNRAMLILEEIHEGKDQFDEVKSSTASSLSEGVLEGTIPQSVIHEEQLERRKYRTSETFGEEE